MTLSLILMKSLPPILDSVSLRQSKAEDRRSLAIPTSYLWSYYDSRLLDDAITVPGLLLTLDIPHASWQTVFTLWEAKLTPMPFPDDLQSSLTCNIEDTYTHLKTTYSCQFHLQNIVSVDLSTEFALRHLQLRQDIPLAQPRYNSSIQLIVQLLVKLVTSLPTIE